MLEIIRAVARQLIFSFFLDFKYISIYLFFYIIVKGRLEIIHGFEHCIPGGCRTKSLRQTVEELIFVGLLSGFFGGVLSVSLGLYIEPEGLQLFLIIMVILSLFNHRFVNPSYAGGLVCFLALIFKYDKIHVPSMLAFIAIVQCIESIFLYLNRKKDHIPIFIEHKGHITGAFIKQKYYMVPFIFLSALVVPYSLLVNQVTLNWGTIFKTDLPQITTGTVLFFAGAISLTNYSTVSISTSPEEKCRKDSMKYLIGSLLLFVFAFFSQKSQILKWVGTVFALLFREVVYRYGLFMERKNKPLYTSVNRGVRILEIIPDGHADKMKMERGEVILNINGKPVQTEDGIRHALANSPTFIWMHTEDPTGQIKIYEHKCYPDGITDLGIIIVPRQWEVTYQVDEYENFTIIKNIVDKFRFMK